METKTFGPFIIREYEIINESQNQVKVAVKALRPVTSKNGRKYTFNEILESHKTMRHKPINVNHDDNRCIGNTDGSKIDEQQTMEVYGTVNKEPYVGMIKNRDPKITGWSVQADFKIAKCVHCSKEFQTMETLKKHLIEDEHLHNINFEPVDIEFNGLALVVSPEVPGVPNTSHEIRETVNFMTLEETIDNLEGQNDLWLLNKISNNTEKNNLMSKIIVRPEVTHAAVGHTQTVVTNASKDLPLTPSKVENEEKKLEASPPSSPLEVKPVIVEAPVKNEVANNTVTNSAGFDVGVGLETPKLTETVKLITLKESKVGEVVWQPIQFESFDVMLKVTNDEVLAGRWLKQNREINESFKVLSDALNELVRENNKPLTVNLPEFKFNAQPLKESFNSIIGTIKTELTSIHESINAIPKDDLGWKEFKPFDPAPVYAKIEEVAKKIPVAYDDKLLKEQVTNIKIPDINPLTEKLTTLETKFATLEAENKTLKEAVTAQKKDFADILNVADRNILATQKSFEERIAEFKKENKTLKETVEKQEKIIKETVIRTDNLEDKQQPLYKGVNKKITELDAEKNPDFNYKPGGA